MSALVAGSVTYTVNNKRRGGNSKVMNRVTLAFGDGALTYPTGGVPITIGNLGCPNAVESMVIADAGTSGYTFNYNSTTQKLQLYQLASHNHDILLKNAAVADGATTRVNAGANLLGANTGGDLTVTGGGANGGVVSKAAVGDAEILSSVAPAALSLIVEVIGW